MVAKPEWARQVRQIPTLTGHTTVPSELDSWINWRWLFEDNSGTVWGKLEGIKGNAEIVHKVLGKPIMLDHEMNPQNFVSLMRVYKGLEPGGECPLCQGYKFADWGMGSMLCYCTLLEMQEQFEPYRRFESAKKDTNRMYTFKTTAPNLKTASTRKEMLQQASFFIDNPSRWLLFCGSPGIGKTHLLQAIAYEFDGIAFYFRCQDLANIYGQMRDGSFDEFRWAIRNIPILLLDDYGSQHSTEFINSVLLDVIDYRSNRYSQLPTVISTNQTLADLTIRQEGMDNVARLGDRITDRSIVTIVSSFSMPSYRQQPL